MGMGSCDFVSIFLSHSNGLCCCSKHNYTLDAFPWITSALLSFNINIDSFYSTVTSPPLNRASVCFLASQDLNKRLSLPADIRIPDGYLEKLQLSSPPFDQPLSRRSRRASLVSAAVRTRERFRRNCNNCNVPYL